MRILLATKYWRDAGGVENHAKEVQRWLESLGHEVVPFAVKEADTWDTAFQGYFPSDVDFRANGRGSQLRSLERSVLSSEPRKKLRQLLKDVRIDAAYTLHVYHQLGTVLLNELALAGIPNVLSLHDYKIACGNYRFFSERTNQICTRCLDDRVQALYAPVTERCWSGSRSAGVALVLESVATSMRQSYLAPQVVTVLTELQRAAAESRGVASERIRKIPHPVDLLPESGVGSQSHFLYVGRLVPEKGVDHLIRALKIQGGKLIIAGSGREEEKLKQLALEINADVEFIGSVPHAEVDALMRDAIALVVPSVWHEVSPLVVYEAISRQLPVIASRVGGMIDQLEGGRGYLYEAGNDSSLADTLALVRNSPGDARARSEAARAYAAKHWSRQQWEHNMTAAFAAAGVVL